MGSREGVALVLAGGGARGAYEAGALSVLLPVLEARQQRPTIFLGTSAGAINATAFASLAHLDAKEASAIALERWRGVTARSVYRSPLRAGLSSVLDSPLGAPRRHATGLLDTTPLLDTLGELVDWPQLHDNVRSGVVRSVGVVATTWATRQSTVFLEQPPQRSPPPFDGDRAIDYVATTLGPRHVLASCALPVIFPAVAITRPEMGHQWYIDGGVRLNTPIKPALSQRAERVVVVATSPGLLPEPAQPAPGPAPGAVGGAAKLLSIVLDDRMLEDLRMMARRNEGSTPMGVAGDDDIPWLFVGPPSDDADHLTRLTGVVLAGSDRGRPRPALNKLARRAVGQVLARDPARPELLSYLFFDREFIDEAISLGQRHARRALDAGGGLCWRDELLTSPAPPTSDLAP